MSPIDWIGESQNYLPTDLFDEGKEVRMSGQDVERGLFLIVMQY